MNIIAGNSSYFSYELFLMLLGLRVLTEKEKKSLPKGAELDGESYWRKAGTGTNVGKQVNRDLKWNFDALAHPIEAVKDVPYKDWLILALLTNDIAISNAFNAVLASNDIGISFDLSAMNINPKTAYSSGGDSGWAPNDFPLTKAQDAGGTTTNRRAYTSAISIGLTGVDGGPNAETIVIGIGMRRSIAISDGSDFTGYGTDTAKTLDLSKSNALELAIENYLPLLAVTSGAGGDFANLSVKLATEKDFPTSARSVQAGIALMRHTSKLGTDTAPEILKSNTGIRFGVKVPFNDGGTSFGTPLLGIDTQKFEGGNWVPYKPTSGPAVPYQELSKWKVAPYMSEVFDILKALVDKNKSKNCLVLLDSPFSPIAAFTKSMSKLKYIDQVKDSLKIIRAHTDGWKKALKDASAHMGKADYTPSSYSKNFNSTNPEHPKNKMFPVGGSFVSVAQFLGTDNSSDAPVAGLGFYDINTQKPVGGSRDVSTITLSKKAIDMGLVANQFIELMDGFPLYAQRGVFPKKKFRPWQIPSLFKKLKQIYKDKDITAANLSFLEKKKNMILQLAVRPDDAGGEKDYYFGARGQMLDKVIKDPEIDPAKKNAHDTTKEDRPFSIVAQIGKWLSPDSDADNWYNRLLCEEFKWRAVEKAGGPGFGVYGLALEKLGGGTNGEPVNYKITPAWRVELVSAGVDIYGTTADGLVHYPRLSISGVELRVMLSGDKNGFDFGIAALLSGVSLNLGPLNKKGEANPDGDEKPEGNKLEQLVISDLQEHFDEPEKPKTAQKKTLDTHLKKEVNSLFSIEVGYLIGTGNKPILDFPDIQLYNADGKRGRIVWIPLERKMGPLYLKALGIGFKGLEIQKPQMTLVLTGGLQFANFELGVIGAGVSFPIHKPSISNMKGILMGLDVALNLKSFSIMGAFMKDTLSDPAKVNQYLGEVKIDTPVLSVAAMGAYGTLADGAKTMFLYAAVDFKEGIMIIEGVSLNGLALGMGWNRKVVVPLLKDVSQFTMVEMVMGDGVRVPTKKGEEKEVKLADVSSGTIDPSMMLQAMSKEIVAEEGHFFGALGVRFMLLENLDCFALLIVQMALPLDLEFTVLGLGRMQDPKAGDPVCYVEVALKADIKPTQGSIIMSAALTSNSWVLDPECKLSGGQALGIWTSGLHKGEFVYTMGGYYPTWQKPAYYPSVPRLGLNWSPSPSLTVKGSMYYAMSTSMIMAGINIDANYSSGIVSAWFNAYGNMMMNWLPFHYELTMGIHIRVSLDLFFTLHFDLGLDLAMHGTPTGGRADVHICGHSFSITFGSQYRTSINIDQWAKFGRCFLDQFNKDGSKASGKNGAKTGKWALPTSPDKPVPGPSILKYRLVKGSLAGQSGKKPKTKEWFVRGDEMVLALNSVMPVSTLQFGKYNSDDKTRIPTDVQWDPKSVCEPLVMDSKNIITESGVPFGLAAMDKKNVTSSLNLTIFDEEAFNDNESDPCPGNLKNWTLKTIRTNKPASIWNAAGQVHTSTPNADVVADCMMGIAYLAPPKGGPSKHTNGYEVDKSNLAYDDLSTNTLQELVITDKSTLAQAPSLTDQTTLNKAIQGGQAIRSALLDLDILEEDIDVIEGWRGEKWSAMKPSGQTNWKTLGWLATSWTDTSPTLIPKLNLHWGDLSTAQQAAATALGFDYQSWEERFTAKAATETTMNFDHLYATPLKRKAS